MRLHVVTISGYTTFRRGATSFFMHGDALNKLLAFMRLLWQFSRHAAGIPTHHRHRKRLPRRIQRSGQSRRNNDCPRFQRERRSKNCNETWTSRHGKTPYPRRSRPEWGSWETRGSADPLGVTNWQHRFSNRLSRCRRRSQHNGKLSLHRFAPRCKREIRVHGSDLARPSHKS